MLKYQDITLGSLAYIQSCVSEGIPLEHNPVIQECVSIQEEIDQFEVERQQLQNDRQDLETQADRVRRNIEAVQQQGDVTNWVKDLDDTEKEIRVIEKKKLPVIKVAVETLRKKLQSKLKMIDLTWEIPQEA